MRQRHKVPVKGLSEKIAEATPPPPNPNKITFLGLLTAKAFGGGTIYAGTVPAPVVARRRAANKRARIARRAARR